MGQLSKKSYVSFVIILIFFPHIPINKTAYMYLKQNGFQEKFPMGQMIVERAGVAVSSEPSDVIMAKSLGSTLAVVASDPEAGVAGICHCVLPEAGPSGRLPEMVDQMRELFKYMLQKGASAKGMKIMLCGAATFLSEPKEMALGVKLYKRAVKALTKNGLKVGGEHVGGPLNRSVSIEVGSDTAKVILPDKKEILI